MITRAHPTLVIAALSALLFGLAAARPVDAAHHPSQAARLKALERQAEENRNRAAALERQAEESRGRAAALADRTAQLQKDLDAQRQDLTDAAADVRAGEEALSALETERAGLGDRLAKESVVLAGDQARLAGLTAGLVRLVRTPPGGLLAWPGAPIDAARGEILLQAALTGVRDRAERARADLAGLDQLGRDLDDKKREAERAAVDLKSRQAALAGLVEKRQALYRQTENDRQAEEARATKIAASAKDLRDLMARIEDERAAAAERKAAMHPPPTPKQDQVAAGKGMPVAGRIKIHFGQNDGVGTTSHGVTLIARPGATVTAPAAGIVRFAGPFRGYREILILEHPEGYHSLIAGMAHIDVALNIAVGAGEPVGAMDDRPNARPELYYELRHNGQPVDPMAAVPPVDVKGQAQ